MMLMSGDVVQQHHRNPIDPIRPTAIDDAAPRCARRWRSDLLRDEGAAEV